LKGFSGYVAYLSEAKIRLIGPITFEIEAVKWRSKNHEVK